MGGPNNKKLFGWWLTVIVALLMRLKAASSNLYSFSRSFNALHNRIP